ncbi:MAG: CinA family protein, partial [Bacteroidota bacterium]|nr:CinA family protein [Bacteroidota bacterium]
EEDRPIEAQIGRILTEKQLSIAVAESFTGGRIAALLSSIPGASAYFFGGIVAYKTSVKSKVLGVSEELIASHSVVSEEVVLAMANGVRKQMKSDYAIATTGNAGPTKGDSDAEVGTVWIALVGSDFERVQSYNFGKNREKTVQKAVNKALELARKMLM